MIRLGIAAVFLFLGTPQISAGAPPKGLYVGANVINSRERTENAAFLVRNYEPNAIVVDKKDDRGVELAGEKFRLAIGLFRLSKAFIICRIVTFKDTVYAAKRPELFIRSRKDPARFWRTYRKEVEHFLDPALEGTFEYIRDVSRRAVEDGCDELNYDYIRFPSDGDMKDLLYPSGEYTARRMRAVMQTFLERLTGDIRRRASDIRISADLFGYAAMGRNPGVGQFPEDFSRAGILIYGMFYPSHYMCNEFGIPDPNTEPYVVISKSIAEHIRYLLNAGAALNGWVTPWIQGFDLENIYGCGTDENGKGIRGKRGKRTAYATNADMFRRQIAAIQNVITAKDFRHLGLKESWIVWHPSADYRKEQFLPKAAER